MNWKYLSVLVGMIPGVAAAGAVPSNDHEVLAVMSGYDHKGMFLETSTDIANPNNCSN